MNKVKVFLLMLLPFASFSGTYRIVDYSNDTRSGKEVHYYLDSGELFTVEEYYGSVLDGYEPDSRFISYVTNVVQVEIPAPIQAVAAAYKTTLEGIYGAGATTNTALTREAVAIDLSLNTNITADTGLRLSTWFEILDGYWGRGEVWSFPYDATSYSVTNVSEVWEAAP